MGKIIVEIDTPNKVNKKPACAPKKHRRKAVVSKPHAQTTRKVQRKKVHHVPAKVHHAPTKVHRKPTKVHRAKPTPATVQRTPTTVHHTPVKVQRSPEPKKRFGFASFFQRRSGSLFRIKQPPYTTTAPERLDDGPNTAYSQSVVNESLGDQVIKIGGGEHNIRKLKSAKIIRVKGEGYRLANGSPVFVNEEGVFIYGHVLHGEFNGAGQFDYDIVVGKGIMNHVHEDDITPIDDTRTLGLSDGADPDPKDAHRVAQLNKKFRAAQSAINKVEKTEVYFVAYCGGKYGYMMKRFVPSMCTPPSGTRPLEQTKPIGMGPKGLDRYFQRKYGLSWNRVLGMSAQDFKSAVQKVVEKQKPTRTEVKRPAPVKVHTRKPIRRTAARPIVIPKPKAPVKAAAPVKVEPPVRATPVKADPKPRAVAPRVPAPRVTPSPKVIAPPPPAKSESSLDAAEEGMNRLEAMLAQAIKKD
jgi:hypothetical protein